MQVILDSSFARPGSAPIWGGKKGEFRDWTNRNLAFYCEKLLPLANSSLREYRSVVNFLPFLTLFSVFKLPSSEIGF